MAVPPSCSAGSEKQCSTCIGMMISKPVTAVPPPPQRNQALPHPSLSPRLLLLQPRPRNPRPFPSHRQPPPFLGFHSSGPSRSRPLKSLPFFSDDNLPDPENEDS